MNLSTVTTVAVLLALLLSWYALLKYVERRLRRKDVVHAETPATRGGREAGRERGRGLFALVLAALPSDFFFVRPAFVFSLDWQVFRLSLFYLFGALLSAFISRRLSSTSAAS